MASLTLILLPETYAVCKLPPDAAIPPLPLSAALVALTLTRDELSLVLPEAAVPEGALSAGGWRALRVAGALDFALTGVLAGLTQPLAAAGVSVFAISTYDTDYLLTPAANLSAALDALRAAGYTIA